MERYLDMTPDPAVIMGDEGVPNPEQFYPLASISVPTNSEATRRLLAAIPQTSSIEPED